MKDQISVYEMLGLNEPIELIEKEQWGTPPEIIESARAVFGEIELDPATSDFAQKTVRATKYYTEEDDGLTKSWNGKIWLNPPYTSGYIDKFTDKLLSSDFDEAILLVNNNTETKWFRKCLDRCSAIVFPTGRIKFINPQRESTTPMQGQAIFYFGNNQSSFLDEFTKWGWGIDCGQNNTRRLYADSPGNGE